MSRSASPSPKPSILPPRPRLEPASAQTSGATTAVTLASASPAEIALDETPENPLQPVALSILSDTRDHGSFLSSGHVSGDDDSETDAPHDESNLVEMLNGLVLGPTARMAPPSDFNVLTGDSTPLDDAFVRKHVLPAKLSRGFRHHLKQFFILSAAGKPIYSLHGEDDVLMGYMGLITTIMAGFHEGVRKDVHSIVLRGFRMVVMNRAPVVLVAVSRVRHELCGPLLERQLAFLHAYMVAVLSSSVIAKNFDRGMNYDLRRILTQQDFHVLDTLTMRLLYGFSSENDAVLANPAFFLHALLDHPVQCARITNTTRSRLGEMLLSCKKIRVPRDDDAALTFLEKYISSDATRALAGDLLFAFVTLDELVVASMRPRNHRLHPHDVSVLLSTISLSSKALDHDTQADLWIPLCMPNFNSAGFLYCYVKKFTVGLCAAPLTAIFMSGNKNSFYDIKQAAHYVLAKIERDKKFAARLGSELAHLLLPSAILRSLPHPVEHFIFKRKDYGQMYMDLFLIGVDDQTAKIASVAHVNYFYASLANSKSDSRSVPGSRNLTYTRWQLEGLVTGFLLVNEKYEFYCLSSGSVSSQRLIDNSLKIIKWCEQYRKRLFVRDGVAF